MVDERRRAAGRGRQADAHRLRRQLARTGNLDGVVVDVEHVDRIEPAECGLPCTRDELLPRHDPLVGGMERRVGGVEVAVVELLEKAHLSLARRSVSRIDVIAAAGDERDGRERGQERARHRLIFPNRADFPSLKPPRKTSITAANERTGGRPGGSARRSRRRGPQELRRERRPRRHRSVGVGGRGARRDRPEREREEHASALHQPARADRQRAHLARRRGDHCQGGQGRPDPPADRDRLPAVQPLPAPEGDRQRDPGGAPCAPHVPPRGRVPGARATRESRSRGEGQAAPAPVVRRPAAARRDRPRADDGAASRPLRRGDVSSRPGARRRGARRHARPRGDGHDDGRRHARDAVRPRGRRSGRLHGRRPDRRGRDPNRCARSAETGAHEAISAAVAPDGALPGRIVDLRGRRGGMKRLVVLAIVVALVTAAAVAATLGSAAPSGGVTQAKLPPKPRLPALPAAVKARGKWLIGVKCDTPPFGWQDTSGKNRGYDVEVARQFAKWAFGSTSKVDFTCVTTASRIGTLTSGRVDIIISTLTWTADRERVIDYSVPYYNAAGRLLVKNNVTVGKLANWMSGKKIVSTSGSIYDRWLKNCFKNTTFQVVSSPAAGVLAVKNDQADAMMYDDAFLVGVAATDNSLKLS